MNFDISTLDLNFYFSNIFTIIFLTLFCIQLFYNFFFFIRLALHFESDSIADNIRLPITIIICAKNEYRNLNQYLISSLIQENNSPFEILVVNDNSEDDTNYLIDDLKKQYSNLSYVTLTQEGKLIPGKKYPLAIGIRSAKYETLLLTDADCLPATEHWLKRFQQKFSNDYEIVLGYVSYFKEKGLLNVCIRFNTYHNALQYLSYCLAGFPFMGVGGNLAYNRKIFLNNKGFASLNHLASGDDDLFINQVANSSNTTICVHPDAFVFSEPKHTWKDWIRQRKRHLSTAPYYKTKHKFTLFVYQLSINLIVLSLIGCIWFLPDYLVVTLGFYLLLIIIRFFVQYATLKKLQETSLWYMLILFDFFFPIISLLTFKGLFNSNKNNWS